MSCSRIVLSVSCAVSLAACAGAYHPANLNGGYQDVQLTANVFRVTVAGTLGARQRQTDDMALLRSAEVTLQHGFRFFTSSGNATTGSAVSIATNVVAVPATTMTIACYPDRPQSADFFYDAEQVVAALGPRYRP